MNKKDTGNESLTLTNNEIYQKIKTLYDNHCNGYIIIETGDKWINDVVKILDLKKYKIYTTTYASGNKILTSSTVIGTNHDLPLPEYDEQTLLEIRGQKIVDYLIDPIAKAGAIFLDPCCGKCLMGKSAVAHGMQFIGNEMNAKRANTGHNYILSYLAKHEKKENYTKKDA